MKLSVSNENNKDITAESILKAYEEGTSYTIKVEAIDENGKVLQTATRNIKTKLFSKITGGFGTLVPNELLVTFVWSQKSPQRSVKKTLCKTGFSGGKGRALALQYS